MNLRVAIFEKKSLSVETMFSELIDSQNTNKWIVMGHFDLLTIYKLDNQAGFFKTIYEKNKELLETSDCNSYSYPIYLLSKSDDTDFWNAPNTFSAIVKVHFSSSVKCEKNRKILEKELKSNETFKNVRFEIYNTFELSDVIIVFKSDYLSSILKCTSILRSFHFVGKIYTYPMISIDSLNQENLFKTDDKIDYMSLKISLYSSSKISALIKMVKNILGVDKAYSITGLDDVLFSVPNATARDLYKFYSKIFIDATDESSKLSNLITRVGITIGESEDIINADEFNESNKILFNTCNSLLQKLDEISSYIESERHKWFISLYELIKLLSRMSNTPVLDEFVYLLLPGLLAFINNLSLICTNQDMLEKYCVEYNTFVQSLNDLIEQSIRSEGQLTHSPELRPVMYNLPVVMLEYTQAFLKQCSDLIKKADLKNENIRLLLVPKIINRIEALEIFAASGNKDGLIEIGIPLDMLYKPLQLQCNLCHEISHFIGERHRNREKRLYYYTTAVSILISKILFEDYSHRRITAIKKLLSKRIDKYDTIENKNMMCQMQKNVEDWIEEWFDDDKNYYEFIRKLFKNLPPSSDENAKFVVETTGDIYRIYNNYSKYFIPLLYQIGWLFKEIYADICMLFLLSINDSKEYIKQFASELDGEYDVDDFSNTNTPMLFGTLLYEAYIIRIYVSLKATGNSLPTYSNRDPAYYRRICEMLYKIDNYIDDDNEIDSYIPLGVVIQLLNYAKECYTSLKSDASGDLTYEYIKNNTLGENPNFDYERVLKFIEKHREDLLLYFKENL